MFQNCAMYRHWFRENFCKNTFDSFMKANIAIGCTEITSTILDVIETVLMAVMHYDLSEFHFSRTPPPVSRPIIYTCLREHVNRSTMYEKLTCDQNVISVKILFRTKIIKTWSVQRFNEIVFDYFGMLLRSGLFLAVVFYDYIIRRFFLRFYYSHECAECKKRDSRQSFEI